MFELSELGFGDFFKAQWAEWSDDGLQPARVACEHRGRYEVWSADGAGDVQLAGRLQQGLNDAAYPGAGDWVALRQEPDPHSVPRIERVFARRTVFTRGAAGAVARAQVIAANVDLVFVVCGLDGDYNVRRIERYLARVWASGAQPVIVLSKSDLCPESEARLAEVEAHSPGVSVYLTNALHDEGIRTIRAQIQPGLTAAFVGSSGAGKSTLINALLGEDRLATAAVRANDSRGRHTTTRRQLVALPGGGLVLDTPGMRELQLTDDEGMDTTFPEIAALAVACRYRDCRHGSEPGCAVKAAVDSGQLPVERYEHYQQLLREAQAYSLRHNAHLKHKSERVWGSLEREGREIRRRKEGR